MGAIIYFIIGIVLITYTSVRQYQREREEFIKNKLQNSTWWVATVVCVLLWPILVAWALIDAIHEVESVSE